MGNSNKKQSKCLVVGIDNSGKSTLINTMKPQYERNNDMYATVGFQVGMSTNNVDCNINTITITNTINCLFIKHRETENQ